MRTEWKDRRDGRRKMEGSSNIGRAAREITGPTGWVWSNAWNELDNHGEAYMKSFDRRVPASIFISERDRTRFGQPMPIAERCIEDWEQNRS